MTALFYKFWDNIINSFRGRNLLWHFVAIASTYMLVVSGFDWAYFQLFQGTYIYYFLFSAAAIGGLLPILFPLAVLILGYARKNALLMNTAYATAQAAMLGSIISSTYKAFTGRFHPSIAEISNIDISQIFQFGFLKGGIFWGWPSSHTTIAFAMSAALWALYPKNKLIKTIAALYAFFIGIGVSMNIHWFSDFVAGAIIGIVVGTVVGKAFLHKLHITHQK
ncbi:MAG: phosphatase PAP2 family protein [Candidatus Paceibacterota bacterium]|jgi:membrane-associated phospholipid phosphatase